MSESFSLVDSQALWDLQVYLARATRLEDGPVRLVAGSSVLAVYTAIFYPRGLLDQNDTVLGLRTWELTDDVAFDVVVPVRSLVERLALLASARVGTGTADADPVAVGMPREVSTVTWAGIAPPRGGWAPMESVAAPLLEAAARAGIDEVAALIPQGTGEQIVQRVRSDVWGRQVAERPHIPAGAAFAAFSLGFLTSHERVSIFQTGPWTRLTTARGHVLIRRRPGAPRP